MTLSFNLFPVEGSTFISAVNGRATTDAVAMPSVSGNTTVNTAAITGVADTSAFLPGDMLSVVGATQNYVNVLRTIQANSGLTQSSAFRTTAAEAVTVRKMVEIPLASFAMPFCARQVEWNDETNGVTWTWRPGMPLNMALKRVWATGVQSMVAAAIYVFINKLCVGPDVAPPSSAFSFRVEA